MTHLDEGTLQAYLDHEVVARVEIDEHLAACAECAAKFEELHAASRLFAAALHGSDVRAPVQPAMAAVKARRPQPLVLPMMTERRSFLRVPLARAAILLVGLAAVASAAIPGTPVNAWINSAIRMVAGDAGNPVVPAPPASGTAEPVAETVTELGAALAIQPANGRVRIVLVNVSDDATIRVRLIDSDRATVRALGAATHARFRTGPGRVEVIGVLSGEVAIELPRAVQDARVEIDGRVIFQKEGGQLHLREPAATGANSEFIFRP